MLDFIRFLLQRRKAVLVFNAVVALSSVVLSLLLPKWYKSELTFLMETESLGSSIVSMIGYPALEDLFGISSESEKMLALLNSRRILDAVIDRFSLREVYNTDTAEDTYEELLNNVQFVDNDDETITIECLYKENPEVAAEMANFFFEKLIELEKSLHNEKAKNYRLFMSSALDEAMNELKKSEVDLNEFQNENSIIDMTEQTRVLIQEVSSLEASRITLELERDFLKTTQSIEHPDVRRLSDQIEIMTEQISQIKKGTDHSSMAFEKIPDMSLSFYRLSREVQIRQKIVEFLVPIVEQSRIEEKKDSSKLIILDQAIPAEKKAKPHRALLCFFLSGLGFTVSTIYWYLQFRYGFTFKSVYLFIST